MDNRPRNSDGTLAIQSPPAALAEQIMGIVVPPAHIDVGGGKEAPLRMQHAYRRARKAARAVPFGMRARRIMK